MDREYVSIQKMAVKWNMSKRRIQVLCKEGRLAEAKMIGNMWVLPEETERPLDARKKAPILRGDTRLENIKTSLKSLLKDMYCIVREYCSNREKQRSTVLSIMACALVMNYIDADEDEIYRKMANELDLSPQIIPSLLDRAKVFVKKYKNHKEVDNVVSWAYQYSNKILSFDKYTNTQFFTEQYMVNYLNRQMKGLLSAEKIVDPCCGGGNFLLESMEFMSEHIGGSKKEILNIVKKLYGYDIDDEIAKIAHINLKIKTIAILARHNLKIGISIWDEIETNVFISKENSIGGALDFTDNHEVINIQNRKIKKINDVLGNADFVLTNPPFETVKGMDDELRSFLKRNYTLSSCDTCVAFIQVISKMLKESGMCGIVTQNSWMNLKSFSSFRDEFLDTYVMDYVLNLGVGAFADLSGEKTNISLLVIRKNKLNDSPLFYKDFTRNTYDEKKEKILSNNVEYQVFSQKIINSSYGFDFSINNKIKELLERETSYSNIATPMQGTSTGNAKMLVGYFWEHFDDNDWRLVSKGGGYCRWQGLNNSVVKWGENGEFIRGQKGSALRNTKYFNNTFMVFSDTGTAGLNVRKLLPSQIFIASGPGIRVNNGNAYAQIAYLNSRVATYYIRKMSPKLTISAGYIGKLPICENIYDSSLLERNAKLCINLKEKLLCTRPNNYEYDASYLCGFRGNLDECALKWFRNDLKDELLKLEIEEQIDAYILEQFNFEDAEITVLDDSIGVSAVQIKKENFINAKNMDKYLANIMDEACTLKKTRPRKNEMGCDGILEYASRDLDINPVFLVNEMEKNIESYETVKKIYKDLILHNEILELMKYNTRYGICNTRVSYAQIIDYVYNKYSIDISIWINEKFMKLHTKIFKNHPILIYENGSIFRKDT